ncbi:unnamed protein product [Ixodes pacificus]
MTHVLSYACHLMKLAKQCIVKVSKLMQSRPSDKQWHFCEAKGQFRSSTSYNFIDIL